MADVKAIGNLTKYEMIKPPDVEIEGFFRQAKEEDWSIEDILDAWSENENFNNIVLFPMNNYISQFNLIMDDIPYIYQVECDKQYGLLFLVEVDVLEIKDLKNTEELSGAGKVILPFNFKFENFPKKYTKSGDPEFFKLPKGHVILNSVILTLDEDEQDRISSMKLTGKAAEIAARRAQNANTGN